MAHPIIDELTVQRRRARGFVVLFGVSTTVAMVLSTLMAVGLLDYWFRFPNAFSRLVGFSLVIGATLFSTIRLLLPALIWRPSALQIADKLEQRFPQLKDRLSSSLAFLAVQGSTPSNADEARGDARGTGPSVLLASATTGRGSSAMQQSLIDETQRLLNEVPLADATYHKRPLQSVVAAAGCALLMLSWIVADRQNSQLAMQRTLLPFSDVEWPKRNRLQLVDLPALLEEGGTLEIVVVDANKRIPDTLRLQVKEVDREDTTDYELTSRNGRATRSIENVSSDVAVRVIGGDDQTDWHQVAVRPAPSVATRLVTVSPPAYAMKDAYTSSAEIHGLTGSKLSLRGTTDRPVRSARLVIRISGESTTHDLLLDDEKTGFELDDSIDWILEEDGSWWIELESIDGIISRPSQGMAIRALDDQAPIVRVDSDSLDPFITKRAVLNLLVSAQDDLRLKSVEFSVTDQTGRRIEQILLLDPASSTATQADARESGRQWDQYETVVTFDLLDYPTLLEGDELQFSVVAVDNHDQTGTHEPMRVRILSDSEFLERLSRDEGEMATSLVEALDAQQRSIELLETVGETADAAPSDWLDHRLQLEGVAFQQGRVAILLSDSPGSALAQASQLHAKLERNRILNSNVGTRIAETLSGLLRIQQDEIPGLMKSYGEWLDSLESGDASASAIEVRRLLQQDFVARQSTIESILLDLTQSLDRWQSVRGLIEQLRNIRDDQTSLNERVVRLQTRYLASSEPVSDDLIESTDRASEEQLAISRRVIRVESNIGALLDQSTDNPQTASALRDAFELSRTLALPGLMRTIADDIQQERLGQAVSKQVEALSSIEQLIQILRRFSEYDPDQQQAQVQRAMDDVHGLVAEQAALTEAFQQWLLDQPEDADRRSEELRDFGTRQRRLSEKARELAEQLRASQFRDAATRLDRAADAMDAVADAADRADIRQMSESMDEATSQLDSAMSDLHASQQEVEERAFQDAMRQLVSDLREILARQTGVRELSESILDERTTDDSNESFWIAVVIEQQETLSIEMAELVSNLDDVPSLDVLLEQVQLEMNRSVRFLRGQRDINSAIETMQRCEWLLQQLLQQFDPRSTESTDDVDPEDDDRTPPPRTSHGAELRTIRILQESIYQQSAAIQTAIATENRALSDGEAERLRELARLQQFLVTRVDVILAESRGAIEGSDSPNTGDGGQRPPLILPGFGGEDQ